VFLLSEGLPSVDCGRLTLGCSCFVPPCVPVMAVTHGLSGGEVRCPDEGVKAAAGGGTTHAQNLSPAVQPGRSTGTTTLRAALRAVLGRGPVERA
jgi:hypothetical protein